MRSLPNGKPISALGFGCASLWSKPWFDEQVAQEILNVVVEEGVNHLDTGPSYGPAYGERRLGAFLSGRDRDALVISTKVGTNFVDGKIVRGFGPELIARSFEDSMRRLGLFHVDILYLHGPDVPDLNDEVFAFFARLKAEGRITYSGVNSFSPNVLDAAAESPIDAVMLQYNVADFRLVPQIERLSAAGKIIISGTALGRAKFDLSTFLPRNRRAFWYLLRMLRNEPSFLWRGPRLARLLARTHKPAAEAAIQFVTGHPHILSTLFGTSRPDHARENARAGHGSLTPDQWNGIARSGGRATAS